MGFDILDLVFRLERRFGVKIRREELLKLLNEEEPPDIKVGDLFDLVSRKAFLAGTFDEELDAVSLWPIFQRDLSDALGVERSEISKEKGLIHELGGW